MMARSPAAVAGVEVHDVDEFQSEKEQIDELKQWWKENGRFVTTGLILGVAVLAGWKYWNDFRQQRAESASATYEQLLEAVRGGDASGAADLALKLGTDFAATPYASQAALAMAQLHVDNGELDEAAMQLRSVVDHARDQRLGLIARLRLARVLISQDLPGEALAVLDAVEPASFAARFHEVRGDAYVDLGQAADARREYQAALDLYEPGLLDREFVEMKLNDLAVAEPDA